MPSSFLEKNAPSLQGALPKQPQDLPHGLIRPPERVQEIIAQGAAKFAPEFFTLEVKERLTTDLTLQYYFDYLGFEVAYHSTPEGPEVLAVGWEEIEALSERLPEAQRSNLHLRQF